MEEDLAELDALAESEEWVEMPEQEFLLRLLSHGPAIAPALTERITLEALGRRNVPSSILDQVGWICCAVLCDLAVPESVSTVVSALFRGNDDDDLDDLEWFQPHLWQFGLSLEQPLTEIVQKNDSSWFVYSFAIDTLVEITENDIDAKQRSLQLFRSVLEIERPPVENEILKVTQLASALIKLKDRSSIEIIENLYDTDWIDETFIGDKEYSLKRFDEDRSPSIQETFQEHYKKWLINDRRSRSSYPILSPREFSYQEPFVHTEKRGRNDLCWCGSGKKYKKCHLDSDQKR
jgi:SEC-C motif/Protein of unknown function (DUF1186)